MRGRKPRPSWLKTVAGNPGKRPINHDEPIPKGDLTAAPDWLSDEQTAAWDYAIAHAPEGLLKRLDRSILVIWVVAEVLHRDASKRVTELGSIVKTGSGGYMQNPFLAVQNKQALIMMRAAAEMGFTPSARSRVKVDKSKAAKQNPFGGLKDFNV